MGATASSAQRDSGGEGDAAAEQRTAAASDASDDADDTLLQRNGQVSSLNLKTKNNADEGKGHIEQRVLADVCSGFVTLKEHSTETVEGLQDVVSLQPHTVNEGRDNINTDCVTVKEETMEMKEVNKINEVGFKKVFRLVGFKFTLKKDTCEKTEGEEPLANDPEESTSEYSSDAKEKSILAANETSLFKNTPDEFLNSEVSVQPEAAEHSHKPETAAQLDQSTSIAEHELTPEKEASPESGEPMSPIKQFFTLGIFGSLRKKKKDEIAKETKEEFTGIDQIEGVEESEGAEKVDSKCMCLEIPHITYEEEKDSRLKRGSKLLPEGELQSSSEKDKVQGSPLKKLLRRFSTKRQRGNKAAENLIESVEKVTEQPEPSLGWTEVQKAEEPIVGELKPALEEQAADVSPQEPNKKTDSSVSWEALICGSSAKKRARKTNEGEMPDKEEEHEKTTESPFGSSTEGDYDHLTSSNEQDGEGEAGSTWKTFKKMVTPKKKAKTGGSSSFEHIPSDSELNKDDSFSMKKLIPGLKKRKSDGRHEQTSSDETGKDAETGDEDDETPAIIPLSEYEIIEPESMKEVNEEIVEISVEHKMPEATSQGLEQETPNDSESKLSDEVLKNAAPLIIHVLSEDYEELTDYMSKHQHLSDIPEEEILEESIETPTSSDAWTTQDDTLAEDFVDLTADAVTAPELASEELTGDNSTEMVSAVSKLTESPRTSGQVTPVSAEYGIQMSDVILQEAAQSTCVIPRAESLTTKAVSFSPYILQSTTPKETHVFVAHMKAEATAICRGLESQEMESVEELHSAPLVEAIPDISDAVLTELVSDNLTDAPKVAELGTDEVYKAKIWEVKTECQEVILTNEQEVAAETELEQEMQLLEVAEESCMAYMMDKNEECLTEPVTDIELGPVQMALIETMESEAVLDQETEKEDPLHSMLVEPANGQPVQYPEETTETETELEIDSTALEDKVHTEKVELMHVDVSEIQVDIKDGISNTAEMTFESVLEVVSASDSSVSAQEIGEKTEESGEGKIVLQQNQDIPAEQSGEVVASHISESAVESLANVQLEQQQLDIAGKEVSLPEKVLAEKTEKVDKITTELEAKEMNPDMDNIKMEESASEEADSISATKKVKEGEPCTNTESDESENQEVSALTNSSKVSPEMIDQYVGTDNVETACAVISKMSEDVLEHKEKTTEPEASSNVIQTHLESVMPQDEADKVETEEWSQDPKPSEESFKNEQPVTTVATTENPTKQLEEENPNEVEPVVEGLEISEIQKTTEQEEDTSTMTEISAETVGAEQMDQPRIMTATEIKETAVPQQKDKTSVVTELEPESSGPTVIEVTETAKRESVTETQNDTAVQMENESVREIKDEEKEEIRLKCEPLEQFVEEPLAIQLQVEKAEMKDDIAQVTHVKEDASDSTTPEVAPIEQIPPLTSEITPLTTEVTGPEIQTPVVTTDVDTSKQVVGLPIVTPVIVTSAAALDNRSVVSEPVEDVSVVSVERQHVIPVGETSAVSSVIATEAVPTLEMTATVTTAAETSALSPVVEMPDLTQEIQTPTVGSVVMPPTVTAVDETPAVVLVTEVAPPVVEQMALIETMESEAVLDQETEKEDPLHSMLVEPANGQPVQYPEETAETETELEIDSTALEDKVHTEKVELMHVDVSEIQVDIKDGISNTAEMTFESVLEVVSASDSAVSAQEIGEKTEESGEGKIVLQQNQDIPAEQSGEVVASHISESAVESLANVQLEQQQQLDIAGKEVSLPEKVLAEKTEKVDKITTELEAKEMNPDMDNIKMEESASEEADSISATEKVKEGEPCTNTESDESENQEVSALTNSSKVSPEMIDQYVGTDNVETACAVISKMSEDVLKHKEKTTEPEASSNVIQTHLESVMPQDEADKVETEEWSQDPKHSEESFKNEQPVTTVATTENPTKQLEEENPNEVEPVVEGLEISEIQKTTEQEEDTSTMTEISAETVGAEQMDQPRIMTATEIKETAVPQQKDKTSVVTELEPESSGPTVIEVSETAKRESVTETQNDTAVQMENESVREIKDEEKEEIRLKCEPLEQFVEEPLAIELQVEKAEMKDDIAQVTHVKEDASDSTTPEVTPIEQIPPLTSEITPLTTEVTGPEIQTPVVTTDVDTSKQVVGLPIVTPVIVTSAAALDNRSVVSEPVEDVSVVSVERQHVIPVGETSAVSSVIATEAVPTLEMTATVTTAAETSALSPVVEMLDLTQEIQTPTVGSVVTPPTVTAVDETPAVVSVTEVAPPVVVIPAVTQIADTSVVSPLLEIPVIPITSVKPTVDTMAQTPADETSAMVSVTVTKDVAPAVELPETEPPAVSAVSETSPVTAVVETAGLVSVMTTEAASPAVTPAETSVASQVEVSAVKSTAVAVAEMPDLTPVDKTTALVSVTARQAIATVTAVEEESVVETTSSPTADTPVSSVVSTQSSVSVEKPPAVTLPAETLGVDSLIETSVPEAPQVSPDVETAAVAPVVVTPGTSPVTVTSDVIPKVKETMLQVVEQEEIQIQTEPSAKVKPLFVTEKEVNTAGLTEECISHEENVKGSSQEVPLVTSEPQSEGEDDVWEDAVCEDAVCEDAVCEDAVCEDAVSEDAVSEDAVYEDAVDNIGDDLCLITQTDSAVKQESEAAV